MLHLVFIMLITFRVSNAAPATNVKPEKEKFILCEGRPADIFFLLDSSTSIWSVHYKMQLSFLQDLVKYFPISQKDIRVGVGIFSDWYRTQIPFSRFHDTESLQKAIGHIPQLRGNTYTGKALLSTRVKAFRKARPHVARVLIVLTDGESRDKVDTKMQANLIKEEGISVFAIGIGEGPNVKELIDIASEPKEDFVFNVASFDVLDKIRHQLAYRACAVQQDQPYCSPDIETDVMFAYDAAAIGTKNAAFLTDFTSAVISQFGNMDDGTLRAGVLSGNCETDNIHLNRYKSKAELRNSLQHSESKGLDTLINELHCDSYNESRGGRPTSRRVAIICLDDTTDKMNAVLSQIEEAKSKDIEVFLVGIGSNLDVDVLMESVSSPADKHLYLVNNYTDLPDFADLYSQHFCKIFKRKGPKYV